MQSPMIERRGGLWSDKLLQALRFDPFHIIFEKEHSMDRRSSVHY